jgi:hypothetical protein
VGLLFGGGKKSKPEYTGLATQTSSSNVAITIAWGENRGAPNIIQQDDFKSHPHSAGGKGGGGKGSKTYTYSATFIMALGWGVIHGVGTVYKDKELTTLAKLGMTLFTGTTPQSPWGYMTTNHSSDARGYPGIAYAAVANYDLASSNALSQHSFEIQGLRWNSAPWTGGNDADIALVIEDFLSDPTIGVGFDMGFIDSDTLFSTAAAATTGDNAFQTYCRANGWGFSPVLANQTAASDTLDRWLRLTNTAPCYTGYSLKFLPYGTETITANGVTYLPSFPVAYTLTDRDFVTDTEGNEDPVRMSRADPADCKNIVSITIANKANQYNDLPVMWQDLALVTQFGPNQDSGTDAKEITSHDMAQAMLALAAQRGAYVRNSYAFKLGAEFMRIELGDILVAVDAHLGTLTMMVDEVTENDDDTFDIVGTEWDDAMGRAPSIPTQPVAGNNVDTGIAASPVNPPVLFEPPSSLAGTAQVWAAVSGGDGTTADPLWGGCNVWLSTDDATYVEIGTINQPARMGVTTASLAAFGGTNPDATHTLSADLTRSASELISASSPADAAAGANLCYVGGEFLSPQTVTPTGTYTFACTDLYRGLYGSTPGSHASGSAVARLDDAVFKYNLPIAYIGVTLYLKFQSFNVYGSGLQDLSTCTAYTVAPTGTGYGGGSGGVPVMPTGLAVTAGVQQAVLSWNANSASDNITGYEVWRAPGLSASFGSAAKIATVTGLTWTNTGLAASTPYTWFLVARNAVGASIETAGISRTTSALAVGDARFYGSLAGIPTAGQELFAIEMKGDETFAAGLASNLGGCAVGPTGAVTCAIKVNGTAIGSMDIAIGTTSATWTLASDYVAGAGDRLAFYAPASVDPTLSGLHYTFVFQRG